MGLKLIYGRAGSGKSHYCIDEIKKKINNNRKLILLVPEQFTFQTETKLLREIGETSVINAEVLSFKRMAYRVFNECGGITHDRMKDAGKSMLIYKILQDLNDEMTVFNKSANKQGFIDIVSKTVTEFKKYNITQEILGETIDSLHKEEDELKNKLQDLKKLFDEFNFKISKNYIDTDDELTMLAEKLDFCNIYDGAEIWVDEFTTFTPQQMSVLTKLLRRCKRVNITLVSDGENNGNLETDIFNVTKSTERRLIKLIEENKIPFDGVKNLNKKKNPRFKNSEELAYLESHFFSYPFKAYKDKTKDIRIYKANNSYDEFNWIAKDIIRLVRDEGYRFKDISVVCRSIDNYEKISSVIFSEYDIPYFIDKKIAVTSNPLIVLISSVFEIYLKNWNYESVFRYLKTGLTSIDKDYIDIIENYVLAKGIKGAKWREEWWSYPVYENSKKSDEPSIEETQLLNTINDIKDLIRKPLINFFESLKKSKTLRDKCELLYDFLLNLGVLSKIDSLSKEFEEKEIMDKAKEYSQIQDIVMEVLDQMVEVLGNEEITNKEFIKILQVGFEKYEMGVIPLSLDQVNIGDIARIRSRDVKALYIVGVNDGILPSANKEEGILSDKDREVLSNKGVDLASDTKTKAFEEQFLVYTALTIATNYLVITYPLADFEGKALRPSIIVPRLKKIFPYLKEESEIFKVQRDKYEKISSPKPTFNNLIEALRREYDDKSIESYWGEVYSWYKDNDQWKEKSKRMIEGLFYSNQAEDVDKEKIKALYSSAKNKNKFLFNVSRIEKYAQCPFAYYIKYGLKAKDRKIYEFTAPDLGSFMHEILDKFTNYIRNNKLNWGELEKEQCEKLISNLVEEEITENSLSILNSNKRYQYFTNRFKRILTKSVTVISEHIKRSDFKIFKNEFEFGNFKDSEPIKLNISKDEEVLLTGRIDRIDTLDLDGNTYIKIIDYKSGSKEFNLNELYYGLQIQLLVYLDAILKNSKYLLEKQAVPGAILYFKIDDPIIKSDIDLSDEEIKEKILKKLKMNGLLLKDADVVRSMDNSIESISLIIPASFNKDGSFSKRSSVITEEDFLVLRKYVNDKMIELCNEMLSGKIKIEPTKDGDFSYCSYCDYGCICQFDTGIKENKYNIIGKKSDDEIWNNILQKVNCKGGEDNGGN
ncbi:helicase-exonuclease AddAB subunit AddB [Clostridium fallax]|uniref:ATP-dependent helicase/deoxyribonuclease subunit B n=1 Tax=Clostridium fallax TaxID=1533 RepID=A0A1M4W256_9CLOT|nr:helicase-exonuclease AddAB subunit AddB [Clostridium fallax]SHE75245.1 DNA helicase/exodeoxyribonuclease V, subunit B [Clostridium fallax]SQB22838.1 ATP-dependent deoxyribonuclease subunit B [Clostridium fallax]